jgi:hypothetical protein
MILLGAILIAVMHDVFTKGMSETSALIEQPHNVAWISDRDLTRLIDDIDSSPNSTGYLLISRAYEKRGNIKKAMYYIRKAEAIAPLEDWQN